MRSAPPSLSWTGWSLSQRDASYWSFAHSARCQRAPRLQDYAEKGSRHRPGGNTASTRQELGLRAGQPATGPTRCCDFQSAAGAHVESASIPAHRDLRAIAFAGFMERMAALMNGRANGSHWRVRYAPEFAAPVRDRPDYRTDELSPSCKSP